MVNEMMGTENVQYKGKIVSTKNPPNPVHNDIFGIFKHMENLANLITDNNHFYDEMPKLLSQIGIPFE